MLIKYFNNNNYYVHLQGVSVTIEVAYSPMIGRQYINTQFGPTAQFFEKTQGLCGFMDDDDTNDFVGPDGRSYTDPQMFAETCKLCLEMLCNKISP